MTIVSSKVLWSLNSKLILKTTMYIYTGFKTTIYTETYTRLKPTTYLAYH